MTISLAILAIAASTASPLETFRFARLRFTGEVTPGLAWGSVTRKAVGDLQLVGYRVGFALEGLIPLGGEFWLGVRGNAALTSWQVYNQFLDANVVAMWRLPIGQRFALGWVVAAGPSWNWGGYRDLGITIENGVDTAVGGHGGIAMRFERQTGFGGWFALGSFDVNTGYDHELTMRSVQTDERTSTPEELSAMSVGTGFGVWWSP